MRRSRVRLRELRPWAKPHLPTYEARRDYFAGLVGTSSDDRLTSSAPGRATPA